nr:hypothetical protein [Altericroceibacterium endophyticum]
MKGKGEDSMPKRQSLHPDNDLIDSMQDENMGGQQGRAGGNVPRDVGTRSEMNTARGSDQKMERPTGQDNPEEDALKGPKTRSAIQDSRN